MLKSIIVSLFVVGAVFGFGRSTNKNFNSSSFDTFELESQLMKAEESALQEESEVRRKKRYNNVQYNWNDYHALGTTYKWMASLVVKYPRITKFLDIGKSFEGRSILGIKISHKNGNKGVFIEAGIHGREWISSATATYLIDQIINPRDEVTRHLAEKFDWYIFPHTNPDGYVYARSSKYSRLWRKSVSEVDGERCFGVDLNRNWDFQWEDNRDDGSGDPCHETYAGPHAFSEVETRALSEYIKSLKGEIELYLSLHSYGQLILSPYDYTWKLPENFNEYQALMKAAEIGFSKRYNTTYKSGNTYSTLYPASGTSTDWVYGTGIVNFSLTFELRPSEKIAIPKNGFGLDSKYIIPTSEETLDAISHMLFEAQKMGYFPQPK